VTYDHVTIYWLPSNGAITQCGRKAHAIKAGRTSRVQQAWIVSQVNSLREANPSAYRFTCLTAKWTASDNITLRFTKNTITADVERAKVSIQQKICHGVAEATLKRNNTWTTIILPNVPCYNTTTEEFQERHLWTEEHIE